MTLRRAADLRDLEARLQKEIDRDGWELAQIEENMQEQFGVHNEEEVKQVLQEIRDSVDRDEASLELMLEEFLKEYEELLEG